VFQWINTNLSWNSRKKILHRYDHLSISKSNVTRAFTSFNFSSGTSVGLLETGVISISLNSFNVIFWDVHPWKPSPPSCVYSFFAEPMWDPLTQFEGRWPGQGLLFLSSLFKLLDCVISLLCRANISSFDLKHMTGGALSAGIWTTFSLTHHIGTSSTDQYIAFSALLSNRRSTVFQSLLSRL